MIIVNPFIYSNIKLSELNRRREKKLKKKRFKFLFYSFQMKSNGMKVDNFNCLFDRLMNNHFFFIHSHH
jgi:uncharacterized protein YggL (DUF469 family)